MGRLQFDVKYRPQIESGEYTLETRDGRPARIICWNCNNYNPIIALVDKTKMWNGDEKEYILSYGTDGHHAPNSESQDDLFIVTPEPELTDFEQEVSDIVEYCKKNGKNVANGYAKRHAKSLLSLAREQFIKDGYVIEKKAFHDAVEKIDDKHKAEMSIEYSLHCKIENRTRHAVMNWQEFQELAQKFINIGKDEALKDLPRWIPNKFDKHNFETCKAYLDTPRYLCYQDKMIDVSDLVEKLPGFKED